MFPRRHFAPSYFAPRYFGSGGSVVAEPDDLVTSCWRHLSDDAALAAAFGRAGWLWVDEAPADTPLPFATIEQVSSKSEDLTFSGGYENNASVTVSCYAGTKRGAASLAQAVRDALRLASITVQGRDTRDIFVEGGEAEYLGRGPGNQHFYFESVDFDIYWPGTLPA